MCSTGRAFGGKVKVHAAAQAAACKAVAQWEAAKGASHALSRYRPEEIVDFLDSWE